MFAAYSTPAVKSCARCGEEKAGDAFPRIRAGKYLHSYCRTCCRQLSREQYSKNREKRLAYGRARQQDPEIAAARREWSRKYQAENAERLKDAKLRRQYGITAEEFNALLLAQDNACAICKAPDPGGKHGTWQVDHDHSCCPSTPGCGKCVRGLLCQSCNVGIGCFRDDPNLLGAATRYLMNPSLVGRLGGE